MQYLNLGLSVCETKAFGPCGAEARALEYILGSSVALSFFSLILKPFATSWTTVDGCPAGQMQERLIPLH